MSEANEQSRDPLLVLADNNLRDAENSSISRHTRVEVCFDSIYLMLLVHALRAGHPEPACHPSKLVILAGADAVGLDDEDIAEVLDLKEAIDALRLKPGAHPLNLLDVIALARHIALLSEYVLPC